MRALRVRGLAVLGRFSMYRTVLTALLVLFVVALVLAFFGKLAITPQAMAAYLGVIAASVFTVDFIAHRIIRRPMRVESGLITSLIMLFLIGSPVITLQFLLVAALAGATAAASKYVFAWRRRHIFNPAAFGVAVVTIAHLSPSMWWAGTPLLAAVVILGGIVIAWRTETLGVVSVFLLAACTMAFTRAWMLSQQYGFPFAVDTQLLTVLFSSPFLFLGFFMLTEPLTQPTSRWARYVVAIVVAALVGWPPTIGAFAVYPETALLVGNLLAFALSFRDRGTIMMRLAGRRQVTPTVTELTFRTNRKANFRPGQYLELDVPHYPADARGPRREFSLVSAPSEDGIRLAYRSAAGPISTFKQALAAMQTGDAVFSTGMQGTFTPDLTKPTLFVAAGIGVTPFVSMAGAGASDAVVLLLASEAAEAAYLDELAASGLTGILYTPDEPDALPDGWRWAGGERLTAANLADAVPDLAARHAYVSGPPRLIAELTPALRGARSVHTDAFAGY